MCREFGGKDGGVIQIRSVAIFGTRAPVHAISTQGYGDTRLSFRNQVKIFPARQSSGSMSIVILCLLLLSVRHKSVPVAIATRILRDVPWNLYFS